MPSVVSVSEMMRVNKSVTIAMILASLSCASCSAEPPPRASIASPAGWQCGSTGGGAPAWSAENDATGKPVLKQSGVAPYPWCVKPEVRLADGFVEVRFKSLGGKQDQAGGVMWRWQNGDNYYVARANALENNLSLYYTKNGIRRTIKYVDAPVAPNVWHLLRVDFAGKRIQVSLDGKRYIELDDTEISAQGGVGVWTKADSVTAFTDFASGGSLVK